jgi:hypothetical protein
MRHARHPLFRSVSVVHTARHCFSYTTFVTANDAPMRAETNKPWTKPSFPTRISLALPDTDLCARTECLKRIAHALDDSRIDPP